MEILENLFIDDLKKLIERHHSNNDNFLILRYDDAIKQIPHWYDGSRYLRYHNFDELKWAVNDYCDGLAESMLKHIKEEIEQDFLRLTMDRVLNDCVNLPHDITNNLDGKIRDGIKVTGQIPPTSKQFQYGSLRQKDQKIVQNWK